MKREYTSMEAFIKAVERRDEEVSDDCSGYAHVIASLELGAKAESGCAVFRVSEMMENGQGKSQMQDSYCVQVKIK